MSSRRRMIGLPLRRRLSLETATASICAAAGAAAVALAAAATSVSKPWLATLYWVGAIFCLVSGVALVYLYVLRPLQVIANVLGGLRSGDFITRTADETAPGALGLVSGEVNALSRSIADHRVRAVEATELLSALMREIDVAVLSFDEAEVVRFINRTAERLLGERSERVVGRPAAELGLARFLRPEAPDVTEAAFRGGAGRYAVRRGVFRDGGKTHQFLVLSDVSRLTRDEERQAWQRLIRVLSHEINNSLAPIQSIARSLGRILARADQPIARGAELRDGLEVIGERAESLVRFVAAYSQLVRRPPLRLESVDVDGFVRRSVAMETRHPVVVRGEPAMVRVDPLQIEQLLINLVRNAADAALAASASAPVEVSWNVHAQLLEIVVEDGGTGLPPSANLFVPYFTTKPNGTGLGLILSREIAEAHGGSLHLVNRGDRPGCRATVTLPLNSARVERDLAVSAVGSSRDRVPQVGLSSE